MSIRVLVMGDDPDFGGAAVCTHQLSLGLARRGFQVIHSQSAGDPARQEERAAAGIEHVPIPYDTMKNCLLSVQDQVATRDILLKTAPDIAIFADSLPDSLLGAKEMATAFGVPYLAVKHLVIPNSAWALAPEARARTAQAMRRAGRVIALSEVSRRAVRDLYDLPPDHTVVIPNSIPAHFFEPAHRETRAALRREWGVPEGEPIVMTVGNLCHRKGFHLIVEALKALHARGIEGFRCVWIGSSEGEFADSQREMLAACGLQDRVIILGRRDDVSRCLEAADLFLFPSFYETFALVVLEAMAKGVPVVASAAGGIPETVGDCGITLPDPNLGPPATVAAMVHTLTGWLADPASLATLGKAGTERAHTQFSEERTINRYVDLIHAHLFPEGDYVSPGLAPVKPDRRFPTLVLFDKERMTTAGTRRSPQLRRYADGTDPHRIIADRDEAVLLYNIARQHRGRRALLVGCDMGWIACHLALAGVALDALDPRLADPEVRSKVIGALGELPSVRLVIGRGPTAVRQLAQEGAGGPWSLAVLNLGEPEPELLDIVDACEAGAADEAMIVLWNLLHEACGRALQRLASRGWRIVVHDTAQMVGVAWRGVTPPVPHRPNPAIVWERPPWLSSSATVPP